MLIKQERMYKQTPNMHDINLLSIQIDEKLVIEDIPLLLDANDEDVPEDAEVVFNTLDLQFYTYNLTFEQSKKAVRELCYKPFNLKEDTIDRYSLSCRARGSRSMRGKMK